MAPIADRGPRGLASGRQIDREPYQPDCNDPGHGHEAAQAHEKGRFPLRKRQNGSIKGQKPLSAELQQTAHECIRCKCPASARGGKRTTTTDYGLRSEHQLHRELNDARIAGGRHRPEVGRAEHGVRIAERWRVEHIERLDAKLDARCRAPARGG